MPVPAPAIIPTVPSLGVRLGYARVSTDDQNLDLQRDALDRAGCRQAYEEKQSGKTAADRPELAHVLADLRPGDTLVVWRLDRLGRNLIRERTRAGLASARARGRKGGRPPKLEPKEVREIKALLRDPEVTVSSIAKPVWCMDPASGAQSRAGVAGQPLPTPRVPALPFKLNQDRRRHIPGQKRKVTNWREYDESLRRRGSLTVWFSDEAIRAWRAEPRTGRGGQPTYSALAILTALTLRAVFRLPFRQTEGLIGSVIGLLGLDLAVPDHSTLSRRAETLEVPRPKPRGAGAGDEAGGGAGPTHLLVDSTGLKLHGAGEWLAEKHGAKRRRSWRKLHLGVDAETGRIVAVTLTDREVDDASQIGPLLDQIEGPVASLTGDGAYDQDGVYADVAERHPDADVVVPPRSTAVPSDTAETAPTRRDRHLHLIAEKGRMGWQKAAGYNVRARAEATVGRFKRVIGDGLRSRTDGRRATEVDVGVHALNRMLELGRPNYVRIA